MFKKLQLFLLSILIWSGAFAAPIIVEGTVTSGSIPVSTGMRVQVSYSNNNDTIAFTDSLGHYEVTIYPSLSNGFIEVSYTNFRCIPTDTAKNQSRFTPNDTVINIDINSCVTTPPVQHFVIKGNVFNRPQPLSAIMVRYTINGGTTDSVLVDSNGFFARQVSVTGAGNVFVELTDCNGTNQQLSLPFSPGDSLDFNFNYCPPPPNNYSGTIKFNSQIMTSSQVYLLRYEYDFTKQKMVFVDTVSLDRTGLFTFPKKVPSEYLLKAIPKSNNDGFVATYYPSGVLWSGNSSFSIGPHTANPSSIEINLIAKKQLSGNGKISGTVTIANELQTPGFSGTGILLLDENENPISHTYASNGLFEFRNLPIGKYLVWLDQCGIPTTPIQVELSASTEEVTDVSITGNQLGIGSELFVGKEELAPVRTLVAFPNPFRNQLNIDVLENTQIELINALGQKIGDFNLTTEQDNIISTEDWPKGIYFLNVHSKSEDYSIKLLKK